MHYIYQSPFFMTMKCAILWNCAKYEDKMFSTLWNLRMNSTVLELRMAARKAWREGYWRNVSFVERLLCAAEVITWFFPYFPDWKIKSMVASGVVNPEWAVDGLPETLVRGKQITNQFVFGSFCLACWNCSDINENCTSSQYLWHCASSRTQWWTLLSLRDLWQGVHLSVSSST